MLERILLITIYFSLGEGVSGLHVGQWHNVVVCALSKSTPKSPLVINNLKNRHKHRQMQQSIPKTLYVATGRYTKKLH